MPEDVQEHRWAIILDSGYIGSADDTPEVRRITLPHPSTLETRTEKIQYEELARLRVPIGTPTDF